MHCYAQLAPPRPQSPHQKAQVEASELKKRELKMIFVVFGCIEKHRNVEVLLQ